MRFENTIGYLQMGEPNITIPVLLQANRSRLLNSPFDFSQAFDQALRNCVVSIPNRPKTDNSEDAVSFVKAGKCII